MSIRKWGSEISVILVAFKSQLYGHEDDFNYALRELLDEHCSYCTPAGKTEVFGPYTPKQSLSEICWLLQEIGYTQLDYHDLSDHLREKHEKVKGCKPQSWFDAFYVRERSSSKKVRRKHNGSIMFSMNT